MKRAALCLLGLCFAGCTLLVLHFQNKCGDGVITDGEQCDQGEKNGSSESDCDQQCQSKAPVVCGDRITNGDEECDDGNQINGDGCDNNCTVTDCGNGITTEELCWVVSGINGFEQPISPVIADFDDDQKEDLAVANFNGAAPAG